MPVYFQRIASNHPRGIQLMSQSPPGQGRERNQTWCHRLTDLTWKYLEGKEKQSFLELIVMEIFLSRKANWKDSEISPMSKKTLWRSRMDGREKKLNISLNECKKIIEQQRDHNIAYKNVIMQSFRLGWKDDKYYLAKYFPFWCSDSRYIPPVFIYKSSLKSLSFKEKKVKKREERVRTKCTVW